MGFIRRRPRVAAAVAGLVILLVGVGIGSAGKSTPKSATKTVTSTVTVDKTRLVARKSVPKACGDAIAAARLMASNAAVGFHLAGAAFGLVGKMVTAAANQDAATLNALTAQVQQSSAEMDSLGPKIVADRALFDDAAARCR